MNVHKIIWVTAFSQQYHDTVFSKVIDSWDLLPGNVEFLIDDPLVKINSKYSMDIVNLGELPSKNFSVAEIKFWKKSRSIVHAIEKYKENYDICIWLDADVQVLENPDLTLLLPNEDELLSANRKIPKNNTAIDTGYVAFNLKHQKINQFLGLYKNFWNTNEINNLPYRYDTCVLEQVLFTAPFNWKNLWNGDITKGKYYCGFEDSKLEKYFYHYWGKKRKESKIIEKN